MKKVLAVLLALCLYSLFVPVVTQRKIHQKLRLRKALKQRMVLYIRQRIRWFSGSLGLVQMMMSEERRFR